MEVFLIEEVACLRTPARTTMTSFCLLEKAYPGITSTASRRLRPRLCQVSSVRSLSQEFGPFAQATMRDWFTQAGHAQAFILHPPSGPCLVALNLFQSYSLAQRYRI